MTDRPTDTTYYATLVPDVDQPTERCPITFTTQTAPDQQEQLRSDLITHIVDTGVIDPQSFRQHWRIETITELSLGLERDARPIQDFKHERLSQSLPADLPDDERRAITLYIETGDDEFSPVECYADANTVTAATREFRRTQLEYEPLLDCMMARIYDLFLETVAITHPKFAAQFDATDWTDHDRLFELFTESRDEVIERYKAREDDTTLQTTE